MAVYLEKYKDEESTIGHVVGGDVDNIKVEWWTRWYSTTWKGCKRRIGRTSVPWTETIPATSILQKFQFTKSNRLKQNTVEELKQKYQQFRN